MSAPITHGLMSSSPNVQPLRGLNGFQIASLRAQHAEIVAMHGEDPCTKTQAAAHEAGHVLLAHVMGETIKSARLTTHNVSGRKVWLGENRRTADVPAVIVVHDDPVNGFRGVVNNLAGFAGEVIAGVEHPASSCDERYKAESAAACLDALWLKPEGATIRMVFAFTLTTIESNQKQFDRLRRCLEIRKRLTRHDAAQILTHVKRIDLVKLVREISQ